MLKLSLDSTNSINICQEEIYHLTTAGNKVLLSVLLPLPPPALFPSLSFEDDIVIKTVDQFS